MIWKCAVIAILCISPFGFAQTPPDLAQFSEAFAKIAEKVNPAVVNITCAELEEQEQDSTDLKEDPESQYGFGSGVIIDPQGYILTSNHVIESADRIEVRLSDDRNFVAKLIGRDAETDLALIKVDSEQPLPVAVLGNSDGLKPGQWVMAIGNPFVYDHTVTVGVISALNRKLGASIADSFIQTDAAINFGNSGGPLLNTNGEVIGINTLVSSQGSGIGFSVPINTAREVLQQLKEKGKVARGFIGLVPQGVTSDLQKSLDLTNDKGVIVASVHKGSPADSFGIKRYDVIVEIDGKAIESEVEFRKVIAEASPGRKVALKIIRDRKPLALEIVLGERDASLMPALNPESQPKNSKGPGLQVVDLVPELRKRLDLETERSGAVVSKIVPGSFADQASLKKGDVILEVGMKPIRDAESLRKEILASRPGDVLLLYVYREGNFLILTLAIQ